MSTQNESERKAQSPESKPRKPARRVPAARGDTRGFYTSTFTSDEIRRLGSGTQEAQDERNLLRTKILRLARLTPLRKLNTAELEALMKLIRLVAALDALERTGVMRLKVDGSLDPALQALSELDPDDI